MKDAADPSLPAPEHPHGQTLGVAWHVTGHGDHLTLHIGQRQIHVRRDPLGSYVSHAMVGRWNDLAQFARAIVHHHPDYSPWARTSLADLPIAGMADEDLDDNALEAGCPAGDPSPVALPPLPAAHLFDAVDGGGAPPELAWPWLVLHRPGERVGDDVQVGDVAVRRALGEGGLADYRVLEPTDVEELRRLVRLPAEILVLRPMPGQGLEGAEQDDGAPDSALAHHFVPAHRSRYCTPGQSGSGTCRRLATPRPVRRVVIHTLAVASSARRSGVAAVVAGWQRAGRTASAHYLVDRDGTVTQMVREADVAFHTPGNNTDSIGIEHADVCNDPAPLTEALYLASAALVRDLAQRHGFALDATTVRGHVDVNPNHGDPGPYWDWDYYRQLLAWDGTPGEFQPQRAVVATDSLAAPPTGWHREQRRAIASSRCATAHDPWAASYLRARTDPAGTAVELRLDPPATGDYAVALWWPRVAGANSAVTVEVDFGGESHVAVIDQRRDHGRWNTVANLVVRRLGTPVVVRVRRDLGNPGWVAADAVRLLKRARFGAPDRVSTDADPAVACACNAETASETGAEPTLVLPSGFRVGTWIDVGGLYLHRHLDDHVRCLQELGMNEACVMVNRIPREGQPFALDAVSEARLLALAPRLREAGIALTLTGWVTPDLRYLDGMTAVLPDLAERCHAHALEFDAEEAWTRRRPRGFADHAAAAEALFDRLDPLRARGLAAGITVQVDPMTNRPLQRLVQRAHFVVPQAYSGAGHAIDTAYGPRGLQERAVRRLRAARGDGAPLAMVMGLAAYRRGQWTGHTPREILELELARTVELAATSGIQGVRYWSWKWIAGLDGRGGEPANAYAAEFLRALHASP